MCVRKGEKMLMESLKVMHLSQWEKSLAWPWGRGGDHFQWAEKMVEEVKICCHVAENRSLDTGPHAALKASRMYAISVRGTHNKIYLSSLSAPTHTHIPKFPSGIFL